MQLSTCWIEDGLERLSLRSRDLTLEDFIGLWKSIEVDLSYHRLEESCCLENKSQPRSQKRGRTHGFSEPAAPSELEPAEMAAQAGGT